MNNNINVQRPIFKNPNTPASNIQSTSQDNNLATLVPSYKGSNGYTVSVYLSKNLHVLAASIVTPDAKKFVVPQSKILNGLTGQLLSPEQIQAINTAMPNAFVAVYLPTTHRVSIWPTLNAAGNGDNLMMNDKHNPFIGKDLAAVANMLQDTNFRIPSTNKTVGDLVEFVNMKYPDGKNLVKETFIAIDTSVTVHYDFGKPKGSNKQGEPQHVGIVVWTNGGKDKITTNYPINPSDTGWNRIIKKQKPIYNDPNHEPCPKDKRGGGGSSGAGGGSTGGFDDKVKQNNLTDSYNNSNPSKQIEGNGEGEIGGVAVYPPNAIVLDMYKSLYDLTAEGYYLAFPFASSNIPFSNADLQKIIRELAQTIYIHNTTPFYSLHFTKEGTLYSVIHPAYQNTLVGKVIGMLDYFMKGYLNGGYFAENDLYNFAKNSSTMNDRTFLQTYVKSIEDVYMQTFGDESDYSSLSSLIERYQIKQYSKGLINKLLDKLELDEIQQRFQISFRIIAKQKSIEKGSNTLLFNGAFDVFYTVELHKQAVGNLENYKISTEYELLEHFCKSVALDIQEKLPKLPMCADYFKMLDVICGLAYFYSSMKKAELLPNLLPLKVTREDKCLGQFPAYPRTKLELEIKKNTLWDFMNDLNNSTQAELSDYLFGKQMQISPELQTALAQHIIKILPPNALKFNPDELNELVLLLIKQAISCIEELKAQINVEKIEDSLLKINTRRDELNAQLSEQEQLLEIELPNKYSEAMSLIKDGQQENLKKNLNEFKQQKHLAAVSVVKRHYPRYNEKYATSDEKNFLERIEKNLASEFKKEENSIKDEVNKYWGNLEKEVKKNNNSNRATISENITKIKNELTELTQQAESIKIIHMDLNNNKLTKKVAEQIEFSIPLISKSTVMVDDGGGKLVKINGGTGFNFKNITASASALVNNLSRTLENLTKDNLLKSDESDTPIEHWIAVTINNTAYQAFYIQHKKLNSQAIKGLEDILITANMAALPAEKRFLALAAQPYDQARLNEISDLLGSDNFNKNATDGYGNNALHFAAMTNNYKLFEVLLQLDFGTFLV